MFPSTSVRAGVATAARTALLATAAMMVWGSTGRPSGQAPSSAPGPQPAAPAAPTQTLDWASQTFATQCSGCHGDALQGARAGSLLDDKWIYGGDDDSLARTIREGRPEADMPGFASALDEPRIRELVAMIRTTAVRGKARRRRAPPPRSTAWSRARGTRSGSTTLTDALETPWGMAVLPDGRILVTERPGRLRIIEHDRLVRHPWPVCRPCGPGKTAGFSTSRRTRSLRRTAGSISRMPSSATRRAR